MKVPTEVRKGDIKKAIILVVVCIGLSFLFYLKWLKAAKDSKTAVAEEVSAAQIKLQDSTKAKQKFGEIKGNVQLLRELVKNMESRLPSKIELSGKYGKEIIEKLNENKLTLMSIKNSKPEEIGKKLYRIEYTIRLKGNYPDILNFIHSFEKNFGKSFSKLKFKVIEGSFMEADAVLVIYGVER